MQNPDTSYPRLFAAGLAVVLLFTCGARAAGGNLVVNGVFDADGDFRTAGDRTGHVCLLELHKDSQYGPVVAASANGQMVLSELEPGVYCVTGSDSAGWYSIGATIDGKGHEYSYEWLGATVTVTEGGTSTVELVETPYYNRKFRTFLPEVIAAEKNEHGKPWKPVSIKSVKFESSFTLVAPEGGATGLHVVFAKAAEANSVAATYAGTVAGDPSGKSWDVAFAAPVAAGEAVTISLISAKPAKVSKYWWTDQEGSNSPAVNGRGIAVAAVGKAAMPNRINVLNFQWARLLSIGKVVDNRSRKFAELRPLKSIDFLKSIGPEGGIQSGKPRGFGAPLTGVYKSLPPSVYNNVLIADLLALHLSIYTAGVRITDVHFPELLYDDGNAANPFNGKSIWEISTIADSLMTGTYDSRGTHLFADSTVFKALHMTVAAINGAFEGPMDTVSWLDNNPVLRGTKKVSEVPFLHYPEGGFSWSPKPAGPVTSGTGLVPAAFALLQNYPNPFNPSTTIRFDLPERSAVTLTVTNVLGQTVATLLNGETMDEGARSVVFNASQLASGVYFYRMTAQPAERAAAPVTSVKRMLLLK